MKGLQGICLCWVLWGMTSLRMHWWFPNFLYLVLKLIKHFANMSVNPAVLLSPHQAPTSLGSQAPPWPPAPRPSLLEWSYLYRWLFPTYRSFLYLHLVKPVSITLQHSRWIISSQKPNYPYAYRILNWCGSLLIHLLPPNSFSCPLRGAVDEQAKELPVCSA